VSATTRFGELRRSPFIKDRGLISKSSPELLTRSLGRLLMDRGIYMLLPSVLIAATKFSSADQGLVHLNYIQPWSILPLRCRG
jgi:hypothetical protein